MAVPKQRTGRASTHTRRSANDRISAPARTVCPQCGEVNLAYRVCKNCGFYKGVEVVAKQKAEAK